MSDGMGREPAYLSSHATNRYFIPNWGYDLPKGTTGSEIGATVPVCVAESSTIPVPMPGTCVLTMYMNGFAEAIPSNALLIGRKVCVFFALTSALLTTSP